MDLNNPFLPDLSIHRYKVKIKALTPFLIPSFPGSMLRGTFGIALKRTVCLNRKQVCSDCLVRKTCIYHFLRLKIRGKLRDHITLKDMVFAISHRLKILSFLYGEGEIDLLKNLDLDKILKGIKTESQFEWTDFKRFSKRQDIHLSEINKGL